MDRRSSLMVLLKSSLGVALLPETVWSHQPLNTTNSDTISFYESFCFQLLGDHYDNCPKLGVPMGCFIQNCLSKEGITTIEEGVAALQHHCQSTSQGAFETLTNAQQKKLMTALFEAPTPLFPNAKNWAEQLRSIALFLFFNTEYGATEVLAFLPLPGRYEGTVDLTKTSRSWTH